MDILAGTAPYWLILTLIILSGACAGIMAGLLGVGGGLVIVPILVYVYSAQGMSLDNTMPTAIGTSLASIVPTSIVSAYSHHLRNSVNLSHLKRYMLPSLAGAFIGALLAPQMGGDILKTCFGIIVCLIAASIAYRALNEAPVAQAAAVSSSAPKAAAAAAPAVASGSAPKAAQVDDSAPKKFLLFFGLSGFVSALIGIGGGSFNVPLLLRLGNSIHRSIGTSAAFGLTIALPGALGYVVAGLDITGLDETSVRGMHAGYVDIDAMILVVPGMVLCAPLGAKLAHVLPRKKLALIFATFLAIVGVKLLL